MYDNSSLISVSKEFILERITQEQIFKKYLGIEPIEKGSICNPLRKDNHPSCGFYVDNRGYWIFTDPAKRFHWDCFGLVEYVTNLPFKEVLNRIAIDFGLLEGKKLDFIIPLKVRKEKIEIRVESRSWLKSDIEFWKSKYINENQLAKFEVKAIKTAWFLENGILRPAYYYKSDDPCYAYYLGNYEYKLYFPLRKSKRWLQSTSTYLQGYNQLPDKGEHLLHTKSLKDVMSIDLFSNEFDLYSDAPLSETVMLDDFYYQDLKPRFPKQATLFDFDRTGIILARKYQKEYGLDYMFFGEYYRGGKFINKTGIKDFSNYLVINGPDNTRRLIGNFIKRVESLEKPF